MEMRKDEILESGLNFHGYYYPGITYGLRNTACKIMKKPDVSGAKGGC